MKKLFFVFAVIAITALASCNSSDKQESTTETSAPATTENAAPASTETAPASTDASTTTATTAH